MGYRGLVLSTGIRGYVICEYYCEDIYVDGIRRGGTQGGSIWTSTVSQTAALIAVSAINQNAEKHIAASFAGGKFQTSSRWRCSTQEEPGWTTLTFDDRHWQNAQVLGTETTERLEGADQIWLEPEEQTLYCRGWLGIVRTWSSFTASVLD